MQKVNMLDGCRSFIDRVIWTCVLKRALTDRPHKQSMLTTLLINSWNDRRLKTDSSILFSLLLLK